MQEADLQILPNLRQSTHQVFTDQYPLPSSSSRSFFKASITGVGTYVVLPRCRLCEILFQYVPHVRWAQANRRPSYLFSKNKSTRLCMAHKSMAESMCFGCLIGSFARLCPRYECAAWERGHLQGLRMHGQLPLFVSSGDLLTFLLITLFSFQSKPYLQLPYTICLEAFQLLLSTTVEERSSMICKLSWRCTCLHCLINPSYLL